MTIAKRLHEGGWTEKQENKSKEVCDDCHMQLWVAPDGKTLYCDFDSIMHVAKGQGK